MEDLTSLAYEIDTPTQYAYWKHNLENKFVFQFHKSTKKVQAVKNEFNPDF